MFDIDVAGTSIKKTESKDPLPETQSNQTVDEKVCSADSENAVNSTTDKVDGTCNITDVDNMPIVTVKDVEHVIGGEAHTPPGGEFVHLSNNAGAIFESTPELNAKVSSSPVDVVRRSGSRQGERPISLDLETLPEGVSAHSLFAELSIQEPDSIGQVDTGADITTMVGELDTVLKENKELLQAK